MFSSASLAIRGEVAVSLLRLLAFSQSVARGRRVAALTLPVSVSHRR